MFVEGAGWGQMERSGCCGKGLLCLGSSLRKNKKRIVPATRIHDGSAQPTHVWGPNRSPTTDAQNQFLFPSLLAPPSSPASYQNSMVPSSVQSPLNAPPCLNPQGSSRIPLETNSNMFAVGPYAHETALVSPPVFSSATTAPSTAPFTPPPELAAHLTTPSSPDVPFAKLLASSFRDQHELARQPKVPYSTSSFPSPDDYCSQQDNLQAAYQLYPGSPLARLISPAGGTGASTPFAAGGTTGSSTPCPEAENPTPLKVLPAVISTLPNLEHHLAESLQQHGLLESHARVDDHRSDDGQEREENSEGNSDSCSNTRYSGSLCVVNDVLDVGEGHPQSTANDFSKNFHFKDRATDTNLKEDIQDEDLLELPMLKDTDFTCQENCDLKTLSQSTCADSDVPKTRNNSEENLLEYALSLLDGNDADMGPRAIGWGPVDTSLSRESEFSMHSSNGPESQPEDGALNSLSVNPLFSGDGEPGINTGETQKNSTVEAKNRSIHVAADLQTVNPGCCSRCNELASQCEQLSAALRQAQEKQAENERQVDERDQQIRQLIQLLRSKGAGEGGDLVQGIHIIPSKKMEEMS